MSHRKAKGGQTRRDFLKVASSLPLAGAADGAAAARAGPVHPPSLGSGAPSRGPETAQPTDRPSVILILADQLRGSRFQLGGISHGLPLDSFRGTTTY
jgi:hypothetical protein